ncbi:dephospho-CoA kinase [Chitinolyticbacter albus]|uniref:dephospho-CoA kinase n=1 Tax=Chitinolyticbacter albus TaxID=2961951 RepID=UPI00210E8AE1|nr:dephospho-CoA kinase [Chitinolyticbacter albus]
MRVVGLTGGVGSGKSSVAQYFAELGIPIVDTDEIAHALVEPGSPALAELVSCFGSDILTAQGRLDRARLRARVFSDAHAKSQLERILHPRILAASAAQLGALDSPHDYAILVVPLLFEANGFQELVDRVLVVDVDNATQLQRVASRPGLDEVLAERIIAHQLSRQARLQRADDTLANDGDLPALKQAVAKLHTQYSLWAQADETKLT